MEKTALDDVANRASPAAVKRSLSDALDAEQCALNYYELEPGESFAFGYHRHPVQEEVFYVTRGTATFETADGEVSVGEGEAIRFAPGEWQRGRNESEDVVRALAIGVPAETGDVEVRRECPDCDKRCDVRIERAADGSGLVVICETGGGEVSRHT